MAGSAAVARSGRWNVGLVAASGRIGNRKASLWICRAWSNRTTQAQRSAFVCKDGRGALQVLEKTRSTIAPARKSSVEVNVQSTLRTWPSKCGSGTRLGGRGNTAFCSWLKSNRTRRLDGSQDQGAAGGSGPTRSCDPGRLLATGRAMKGTGAALARVRNAQAEMTIAKATASNGRQGRRARCPGPGSSAKTARTRLCLVDFETMIVGFSEA